MFNTGFFYANRINSIFRLDLTLFYQCIFYLFNGIMNMITFTYEHKRHDPENRVFSDPLVCCSIAPVLLSVCSVAQLCRVACLCRLAQFVQYLCTGDIE